MDIDIFYQIKNKALQIIESQLGVQSIYDMGLKTIDSINTFIEANNVRIRSEDYYIISEMINKLFNDRNFQIKIESKDFKTPLRFTAKEEINLYIDKLKLEKQNKAYEIDLDDLDDIEFLLKEYDLVDEKIIIYELLADICYNNRDFDKEHEYLLKSWELMNRYPPEKTNYRITIKLANNYIDRNKNKEAIRIYQKTILEMEHIPLKYKLNLYYNYALAYSRIEMYSFALGIIDDLLKYTEREDYDLWASTYILKGLCHHNIGDYNQAIIDYNKALQVLSFVGYTNKKELIYCNIAISYIKLEDFNTVYKYLDGMIEGLEELNEDPIQKSSVLGKIGRLYRNLEKYKESEEYFVQSLKLAKEISYKKIILDNIDELISLNKIYEVENITDIIDENLEYICDDLKNKDRLKVILKSFNIYISRNQNEKLQSIINRILELI